MINSNTSLKQISTFVEKQLPEFVRENNPKLVAFLEAYYEFMEQKVTDSMVGQPTERLENMLDYLDIDTTLDVFTNQFYQDFLAGLPQDILADKRRLLKHIKSFYLARGTEKSYQFLFRILFGEEIEVFFPKDDILKVSAGNWYVAKSLHVKDVLIDGILDPSNEGLSKFVDLKITGQTSKSTAVVESSIIYFKNGVRVSELFISSVEGMFENNEQIIASFTSEGASGPTVYSANIISGGIISVTVTEGGNRYNVGDPARVVAFPGYGANASLFVSSVTEGSIVEIHPVQRGAGYRPNDQLTFIPSHNANAFISIVDTTQTVHPNSYFVSFDSFAPYANLTIGNLIFIPSGANANTKLINALTFTTFGPCGPVSAVGVLNGGNNFSVLPSIGVQSNTFMHSLGILGRMEIVSGGLLYQVGDQLIFNNPPGSYGLGAKANVTGVAANGAIVNVYWQAVSGGIPTGGIGYSSSNPPHITVTSANGTGANIVITAILGEGATFDATTSSIGSVLTIDILSGGDGFNPLHPATIDLTQSGDGTAQAFSNISSGATIYPGRYLDDSGFPSAFQFIEDQDYYQNFSYVIRVKEALEDYKATIKNLLHPAGTIIWGEYSVPETFSSANSNIANVIISQISDLPLAGDLVANTGGVWSLRRIVSNWEGGCIKIRRSLDNATANIYCTANNDLDSISFNTFVGSSNGYILRWYDQSGHGLDLFQTNTARQPQLIIAHEDMNYRPAILWGDGSVFSLFTSANSSIDNIFSANGFTSSVINILPVHTQLDRLYKKGT